MGGQEAGITGQIDWRRSRSLQFHCRGQYAQQLACHQRNGLALGSGSCLEVVDGVSLPKIPLCLLAPNRHFAKAKQEQIV